LTRVELVERRSGSVRFLCWPYEGIGMVHVLEPLVFQRSPWLVEEIASRAGGGDLRILKQVHGAQILGTGEVKEPFERTGDGLFGEGAGSLGVLTADCLPLLLFDHERMVLLHVGWRGMMGGIVERGCELFPEGSQVRAMLGPCIRGCCYQVDPSFVEEVGRRYPHIHGKGVVRCVGEHLYFDIPSAVAGILLRAGVLEVMDCGLCTFCGGDFPSYRREGERAGRMLTVAWRER